MAHLARPAAFTLFLLSMAASSAQDQPPKAKSPDGVYAVRRQGASEKDILPLKNGERLLVHRHRYLKDAAKEPPRYLVVGSQPEVILALAGPPKAVKEEGQGLRIQLKLTPNAAEALERLSHAQVGKQITIVLGGEVVTMHKVREVIKGGDVQITSCAPGAAEYLLEQLRANYKGK